MVDENWDPQGLVAALEQADTAVEALAAMSRIVEKLKSKLCDDEGRGNSNCPGIARFEQNDQDGEEVYAARVRARALLKHSANAAIIHALPLFGNVEFKKVAFMALHDLNRALISPPNLVDDDDEIEPVCYASSFNRPSTDAAGSSADATAQHSSGNRGGYDDAKSERYESPRGLTVGDRAICPRPLLRATQSVPRACIVDLKLASASASA